MSTRISADTSTVTFSVHAALLRELGERLVGKPHIALAELIKNAYDADATHVQLRFTSKTIEVSDDGHGMDFPAFRDYWMMIGSPHKQAERMSPGHRPLTGQKGVGRLAVQFLGRQLELITRSVSDRDGLFTFVDWDKAVEVGELTKVKLKYHRGPTTGYFPDSSTHGTKLVIGDLTHSWSSDELRKLANEIWALQPPFEVPTGFDVELVGSPADLRTTFESYNRAFRSLWHARIRGQLIPPAKPGGHGRCQITLIFDDQSQEAIDYDIPSCPIHSFEFDVAVYSLSGRQHFGVKLEDLRGYLKEFGGVGIYDGGFRLPFYGVDTDWLQIQLDHSRRITRSQLLPEEYHAKRALNFLPTNVRILGAVKVNTADERQWVATEGTRDDEPLQIAISRDRLIDNGALEVLRSAVRAGVDFYALHEASRELKRAEAKSRKVDRASSAVLKVAEIVEEHSGQLPKAVLAKVKAAVQQASTAVELESEVKAKQANLLGALATAGIAAAAFEHESARQIRRLESIAERLKMMAKRGGALQSELTAVATEISDWIADIKATRQLFTAITEPESREERQRLRAKAILEQIVDRLSPLLRAVPVDISGVPSDLRLPPGTFVEWMALFQNVLLNAVNATLDSAKRSICIKARNEGVARVILIQDTGVGVDLARADDLFEPFVRRLKLSASRRGLGIGGSGLGLAIVRMIAANLGCRVSFTQPDTGFASAFRLAWSEKQ